MNHRLDEGVRHQAARGLQMVWLSFVAVAGIYTLILLLVSQQSEEVAPEALAYLRPTAWVIASILAITSFVWRQQVADLDRLRRSRSTSGFARIRTACIVTWVICELIVGLGLGLGILSYRMYDYAPLIGLGLLLLVIHRPATWPLDHFLDQERHQL